MALDAVCLTAVLEELRKTLVGGKIDKIYQPSREEILLAVRGAGENVKLLLSASPNGPRLHLTREVREHNDFARRVPVVEEQIKVINHRISDLEEYHK